MPPVPYAMLLPSLLLLASGTSHAGENLLARTERVIDGQRYTLSKYVDEAGQVRSEVVRADGTVINEAQLQRSPRTVVAPALAASLRSAAAGSRFTVNVALDLPTRSSQQAVSAGAELVGGVQQETRVNGASASLDQWKAHEKRLEAAETAQRGALAKARAQKLQEWGARHGLARQAGLAQAIAQGSDTVTLNLTAAQLKRLIDSQDATIAGIELHEEPKDEITQAMAATSISTSALPHAATRGSGIGVYMTEGGCADPANISNYSRLSGSQTDHSLNVGSIVRAVSPASYLYCRSGSVLPSAAELAGIGGKAPIYVITNSTGSNATASYNTGDRDWDNYIYNNNVPIFKSAGNEGNATGNVTSPGKGLNTIAVGNYNDATSTISSSSSFIDPETKNEKPEIVAPGSNITAGGITMSGTSMAAPHAAAFTADMMSQSTYLKSRPYLVKAKLLAGGTDVIAGGVDKVGLGGIDFASAEWSGNWQYYSGSNGSFTTFDTNDGASDGYISKTVFVPAGWDRVRVAISWVNRGTWTYDHRADLHPIGMDLDLSVYGPTGAYVGGSATYDNPFESVQFTPSAAGGNYTFKIRRFSNRDTASDVRIGMYVNYFDL